MMNKQKSVVPMVSARKMYEVHEYVYTDDRSLPVYNFYATENTLPALS